MQPGTRHPEHGGRPSPMKGKGATGQLERETWPGCSNNQRKITRWARGLPLRPAFCLPKHYYAPRILHLLARLFFGSVQKDFPDKKKNVPPKTRHPEYAGRPSPIKGRQKKKQATDQPEKDTVPKSKAPLGNWSEKLGRVVQTTNIGK